MDWVAVAAIASSTGVVFVGAAQVRAWRKNGSEQKKRDEAQAVKQALRDRELEMGYQAVVDRLDHPDTGLGALSLSIQGIDKEVARQDERITALEDN